MNEPEGQKFPDGVWVLFEINKTNRFQIYSSQTLAQSALLARTAELVLEGVEMTSRDANHTSFDGDDIELVIDQYQVDDGAWHEAY